jgi:uncharacterized SAM-binding protein YcdF (DUF218 family)
VSEGNRGYDCEALHQKASIGNVWKEVRVLISGHHSSDTNIRVTVALTVIVLLLTLGLPVIAGIIYVLATGIAARTMAGPTSAWLLFGKRLQDGNPDEEFKTRLQRLHTLMNQQPQVQAILLGGTPAGESISEARAGALYLEGLSGERSGRLLLEESSRDTLENLRNARRVMKARSASLPLTLISSRYHLARCGMFARSLGLRYQLCAAEKHWRWSAAEVVPILKEAVYVCWFPIGKAWVRLIRNERLLEQIT